MGSSKLDVAESSGHSSSFGTINGAFLSVRFALRVAQQLLDGTHLGLEFL